MPFLDRGGLFARARPVRSYVIAAEPARTPPEAMLISAGSPKRSIRSHPDPAGEGELLLVGGESHPVGSSDAEPERYERLAEFARLHWDAEAPRNRWSAQDFEPADGIPYVGPLHPLSKRIWVATGLNKWGLSGGTVAAGLICDAIQGRDAEPETAALFSTRRTSLRGEVPKLLADNLKVGLHFIGDRIVDRGGRRSRGARAGRGRDRLRPGRPRCGLQGSRRRAARGLPHLHPSRLPASLQRGRHLLGLSLPRLPLRDRRRGARRPGDRSVVPGPGRRRRRRDVT